MQASIVVQARAGDMRTRAVAGRRVAGGKALQIGTCGRCGLRLKTLAGSDWP